MASSQPSEVGQASEVAQSSEVAPPSKVAQPPLDKKARTKLAKDIIHKTVPAVLKSNRRAAAGAASTKTILYSQPTAAASAVPPTPDTDLSAAPLIRVIQSDTFDAAQALAQSPLPTKPASRTMALSMCSPLRPGGGVLSGAMSQEESLCLRSTLYDSIRRQPYRLPEEAAIYSPDVLVFGGAGGLVRPKAEWFFVDVISCAALRFPDVIEDAGGVPGKMVYEREADREAMQRKVALIFQVAVEKGVTHLVLGALGCGIYRNPPREVADIFRKAIFGTRRRRGVDLGGIKEIVFAIFDDGENLKVFKETFKDALSPDTGEESCT